MCLEQQQRHLMALAIRINTRSCNRRRNTCRFQRRVQRCRRRSGNNLSACKRKPKCRRRSRPPKLFRQRCVLEQRSGTQGRRSTTRRWLPMWFHASPTWRTGWWRTRRWRRFRRFVANNQEFYRHLLILARSFYVVHVY